MVVPQGISLIEQGQATAFREHQQAAGDALMHPLPILESVLTCPLCAFAARETMPTDACLYFYECPACRALLRPKAGDCCVFCSYGSVKCPPIQQALNCCGPGP
jgi:hypothetical protein